MRTKKLKKDCRGIRAWLFNSVNEHLSLNADWVQNHIANCPKCQKRLAAIDKVNLALTLIRSQPHSLELLMHANTNAIRVLKHTLRDSPKAQKLKYAMPEPGFFEKCGKYKQTAASSAACLAIIFLMKTGVFSSMQKIQTDGQKAVQQYYTRNVGQSLSDEIFST